MMLMRMWWFRFKEGKAFLDYSTHMQMGEELIAVSDKELVVRERRKEYHYKKDRI
jgi:hypothetical protein